MKDWGYCFGFLASLMLVLLAGSWLRGLNTRPLLAFAEPYRDATSDEILVGHTREFAVDLKNHGAAAITLEAIESTDPSAKGRVSRRLPTSLAPSESLPVDLAVTADSQRVGVLELGFKARGRSGLKVAESGFRLAVKIVDYANAEPIVVSYGTVLRSSEPLFRSVALWTPHSLPTPDVVEVTANEPCLSLHVKKTQKRLGDGRHSQFAEIEIALDPRKAPGSLRDDILVRTTANQLRIPVLAAVNSEITER
jgi:hypothetical protein